MLKPYGIYPGQVRSSGANKQGYRLSDFKKAFAQYLRNDGREEEAQDTNPVIGTNCFSCQTDLELQVQRK